jgi:hypothetical protein
MLQAFVLATKTFIVLYWTEYLGTKQTVSLWLERAIVNSLGFLDLTIRPRPYFLRRSQPNTNCVKIFLLIDLLE